MWTVFVSLLSGLLSAAVGWLLDLIAWPVDSLCSLIGAPAHLPDWMIQIAGIVWWLVSCVMDLSVAQAVVEGMWVFLTVYWVLLFIKFVIRVVTVWV